MGVISQSSEGYYLLYDDNCLGAADQFCRSEYLSVLLHKISDPCVWGKQSSGLIREDLSYTNQPKSREKFVS